MAAIVNGEPITMTQYHRYLELKPQVQVLVNPSMLQAGSNGQLQQQPYAGQVIGSLGLQGLNDLIQQTVLRQLAKSQGAWPSEQEIEQELSDRSKDNQNFVRDLTNVGFTIEMIRNDIAIQVAQFKLQTQGITVNEDEVNSYIKEHPQEFVQPEAADMIWMLVPDQLKKSADDDLKAGRSFILVAQKYSTAPGTRSVQYRFPERYFPRLAAMGPDLLPAIRKTPEQQQTDWIKFREGWAKFFIEKKTPERKLPIDDAMKKKVRRAIALDKGRLGKDLNQRVQEALKNAKIEIVIPYLQDPWKRSMEQITANATTATGSK